MYDTKTYKHGPNVRFYEREVDIHNEADHGISGMTLVGIFEFTAVLIPH